MRSWLAVGAAGVASAVVVAGAFAAGGPIITSIAGVSDPANRCCLSGDGGPATSAKMAGPHGLVVDALGNVYVSDAGNSRVRKICRSGTITTIAGTGEFGSRTGRGGFSGDGGPATRAKLNYPRGLALDRRGNLYIADNNNHRVRKVDSRGIITTVAGGGTAKGNSWGDGGPAIAARLSSPTALAVDADGNLYIAQSGRNRISKVSPDGTITTVVADTPRAQYPSVGDGGPANSAVIRTPWGLAIDQKGNLYIGDVKNYRVRKVSGGTITTIAGTGEQPSRDLRAPSGDGGRAIDAKIYPAGVAVDAKGNVYIAEQFRERVRKVSPGGTITTAAGGDFGEGPAGDGGPATRAKLNGPEEVAVDRQGNLYIADTLNSRVRKVWNVPESSTASPDLILDAEPTQALSAGKGIEIEASCDKACGMVAVGFITIPGTSRVFKLTPAKATRTAACSRTLTLRLSAADQTELQRLLTPGQRAQATITAQATDKAGNSDTAKRTVAIQP